MMLYRSKGDYELYLVKNSDLWYITNSEKWEKIVQLYKERAYPVYQIGPTGGHFYEVVVPDYDGFPKMVYMTPRTLNKMFDFDQDLSRNAILGSV